MRNEYFEYNENVDNTIKIHYYTTGNETRRVWNENTQNGCCGLLMEWNTMEEKFYFFFSPPLTHCAACFHFDLYIFSFIMWILETPARFRMETITRRWPQDGAGENSFSLFKVYVYLPTFLSRFSVSFSITLQSRFSAVASFWWTFCSPSKLKGQVLYSERCFVERRENFLWELVNQSNVFVFIASNMKMPKQKFKFIHKPALQANTFFNRLATVTTMIWITCYWKKLCNWLTSKTWM